ncbi:hypothetical protein TNCV_3030361 [Trichonephila clavipes]|nr:hypothetical protein TNCV_3030361 [Trichonephila clavipes]
MKKVTNQYVIYPPVAAIRTKTRRGIESMRSSSPPVEDHELIFVTGQLFTSIPGGLQLPSKYVPEVLYWREICLQGKPQVYLISLKTLLGELRRMCRRALSC